MSVVIEMAEADARQSYQWDWDYFFFSHVREGKLKLTDQVIYSTAFNAVIQQLYDQTYRPAHEVEQALERPLFLQELIADKEKYKNAPSLELRAPMTGLNRVVGWHLHARNYPLGEHRFTLTIRNNDHRLPRDPQPVVILYASGGPRFFVPQWLSDLYHKAEAQLITVNKPYKLGAIVSYNGYTYRVVETDSISGAEAANLEEGFDIFDAEGPYSRLELIEEYPLHIHDGRLSQRIDRERWAKIEPYMQYRDKEMLEDIASPLMQPGWYVINESAVEQALGIPEEWHIATRRSNVLINEREKREEEEKERRTRTQDKKVQYAAWKERLLNGLVQFHDWFEGFPVLQWVEIGFFDEESGWPTTGDRWSQSTWNDQIIYSNSYGNTTCCWTTRENAVRLARMGIESDRQFYPSDVDMARHILMTHDQGCIGDASARIVVEEDGVEHYVAIAKQEVWYIIQRDHRTDHYWQTCDKYGLPFVELTTQVANIYGRTCSPATRQAFIERMQQHFPKYCNYQDIYRWENLWFVSSGSSSSLAVLAPDLSDLFPEAS